MGRRPKPRPLFKKSGTKNFTHKKVFRKESLFCFDNDGSAV